MLSHLQKNLWRCPAKPILQTFLVKIEGSFAQKPFINCMALCELFCQKKFFSLVSEKVSPYSSLLFVHIFLF